MEIIKLSKELYPLTVVLKSSYGFTDRCYIHISQEQDNFIINIKMKDGENPISCEDYKNALLEEAIRYRIFQETKDVRQLILTRAFATTVISDEAGIIEPEHKWTEEDILKDWFCDEGKI